MGTRRRAVLRGNNGAGALTGFTQRLQNATLETIESCKMTADLAALSSAGAITLDSREFIDEIALRLREVN
jgi:isocitrate dehydrogenase